MKHEQVPPRLGLGISITLVAYIFFVTASSLVRELNGTFPIIQVIFIQCLVSLLCITPLAWRKGIDYVKTKELPTHLARDVIGVISYYFYFAAINYLNLTDATTLNYSAPFFVPILWWILMKEKIDRNVWWSIIIGFIGVATILNPTKAIFREGFAFGVMAGLTSAMAAVALRILNLKREPMSRTLFYYFLVGTLGTMPFAALYWEAPIGMEWLQLLSVGFATVIAQMLLTVAYRYGTASYLSPLGYASVVYAGVSAWIFFDTAPSLRSVLGTLLIITGGFLTFIFKKKPSTIGETFEIPEPKEKPPL